MRCFRTGRFRLLSGVFAVLLVLTPAVADMEYTVRTGDTLSRIAEQYSIPLDTLLKVNQLSSPDRITVGLHIHIPAKDDRMSVEAAAPVPLCAQSTEAPHAAAPAQETAVQQTLPLRGRALLDARARLAAEQARSGVVASAQSFAGTPYCWGGLTSRGIDCSGLVVRAMLAQGKRVPHNAAMLFTMGKHVAFENLRPGDLVFFVTTGSGISHVGIWIGENKFIHASCGRGVVIDEMIGYYARRLVGARRL